MEKVGSKKRVLIAMSGGVDSSVTAALLKERGFDVRGIHIKMWSDPDIPCNFKEDRYDAVRVAAKLDIPFETWDFTKEYKTAVVEYMIREYALGRTPNPDVMCNRHIKFGIFLERALEAGANYIATGHYVRLWPEFPISKYKFPNKNGKRFENYNIENSLKSVNPALNREALHPAARTDYSTVTLRQDRSRVRLDRRAFKGGVNCKLKIAKDSNKDQSYFLWTLTQEQLKHCLFPIGEHTKLKVRELAKKFGLPTAEKEESQGICFMGEINIRDFLKKYILTRRGLIRSTGGKIIGEHDGVQFYTIGQREGLGIGGGIPYYVAAKDEGTNILTVAEGPYDEKLFSKELVATDVNWISGKEPKLPFKCEARIRYRQPLQSCRITLINADPNEEARILVRFSEAQRAVTPGQSIVFYQGESFDEARGREMLGGGVIVTAGNPC